MARKKWKHACYSPVWAQLSFSSFIELRTTRLGMVLSTVSWVVPQLKQSLQTCPQANLILAIVSETLFPGHAKLCLSSCFKTNGSIWLNQKANGNTIYTISKYDIFWLTGKNFDQASDRIKYSWLSTWPLWTNSFAHTTEMWLHLALFVKWVPGSLTMDCSCP